jgi:hypothetical protein
MGIRDKPAIDEEREARRGSKPESSLTPANEEPLE